MVNSILNSIIIIAGDGIDRFVEDWSHSFNNVLDLDSCHELLRWLLLGHGGYRHLFIVTEKLLLVEVGGGLEWIMMKIMKIMD